MKPRNERFRSPRLSVALFCLAVLATGVWASPSPASPGAAGTEPVPASAAQDEPSEESPRTPYGWRQLRFDLRYLVHRPAHLDRKDKIHLFTAAGVTAGLFLLREEIREQVQDHRSGGRDRFLDDARLVSRGGVAPGLALAAWLASFATGDAREKETALLLVESAALSAALAGAGSYVLATERPEDGTEVSFFESGGRGVSLDAALAAAIVEPLRCQYLRVRPGDGPWRRFFKRGGSALLYGAAALTAYQRLDADKHWAPDVYLGVAGGLAVGRTLCEAHGKRPQRQLAVTPVPVAGGLGVALRLTISDR